MKITLCGSARFEKDFHEWNERLTFQGHVVYSLAIYPSFKDGKKDWYNEDQKEMLDLIHLAKIEESDAILVIDCAASDFQSEYIGSSTLREIAWARIRNKSIVFASLLIQSGDLRFRSVSSGNAPENG